MNENTPDHQEKIRSYLRGNLSKPEEDALFSWVNQSHENLAEFQSFIRKNEYNVETSDAERAWKDFQTRVEKRRHRHKMVFLSSRWSKIAAILLIAMVAGFWGVRHWTGIHSELVFTELFVPFGERTQVDLPDGTKIWLNSGTTFRYPERFNGNIRTVEINGEGYFEVKKDPLHPFVVKTPEFEVRVLGTSFNLSTYKDDEKNSLALQSGSVEITANSNHQKIKLVPGEMAVLDKQEKSFSIAPTNKESIASWLDNTLEFSDVSLYEICKSLERQFDTKIEIKNEELKQIKFSGRFKSDEGLDKLLELLKLTSPVKLNYKHILKNKEEEIVIE
jgi:transmembrane sensor